MKKYILATILLCTAATSNADTREAICPEIANLAMTIMSARQTGVPIETLMQAADQDVEQMYEDLAKAMIMDAYSAPRYSSEEFQQQAITEFGNAVSVACYSSEG